MSPPLPSQRDLLLLTTQYDKSDTVAVLGPRTLEYWPHLLPVSWNILSESPKPLCMDTKSYYLEITVVERTPEGTPVLDEPSLPITLARFQTC